MPGLTRLLKTDPNWEVRRQVALSLGLLSKENRAAARVLTEAIKEGEEKNRLLAAYGLSLMDKQAISPLSEAVKDKSDAVAIQAIDSLGQAILSADGEGVNGAITLLAPLVKGGNAGVRRAAISTLTRLVYKSTSLGIILDALKSTDEDVRTTAARGLPMILYLIKMNESGSGQGRPFDEGPAIRGLEELLADRVYKVRKAAAFSLAEIRPDKATVPVWIECLQNANEDDQLTACDALMRLGRDAGPAVAALTDLLSKNRSARILARAGSARGDRPIGGCFPAGAPIRDEQQGRFCPSLRRGRSLENRPSCRRSRTPAHRGIEGRPRSPDLADGASPGR